jgi:hypothetical protein
MTSQNPVGGYFMKVCDDVSEAQISDPRVGSPEPKNLRPVQNCVSYAIYALVLAGSISIWLASIRDPLWTDETGSYWQIAAGFSKILSRQGDLSFPAYSYILWLSTKIIGTSEIALRIPSIFAMLGAVYLLYLAAREVFTREVALMAAILFSLHPIVVFESIEVRPYAFAVLATNAAILLAFRLRHNNSNWQAAAFGLSAACIVWFHFLFIVILPALVLCFAVVKTHDRKAFWRQLSVALGAFALAFLPVISGLLSMFRTSKTHVCDLVPNLMNLVSILAPGWILPIMCVAVPFALLVSAFSTRQCDPQRHLKGWRLTVCASLALIPVLILYGVSVGTPLPLFAARHELVAVPGIALCWALIVSRFNSRSLRLLFCIVLLIATASHYFSSSFISPREANISKYAFEVAQKNASVDNAPLLLCSDFIESNYAAMPLNSAKDSPYFAELSYYKLSVPIVPLPEAFNAEAIRVGSQFLQEATRKHERFLAVAHKQSYGTLDWLAQNAAATYSVRKLGVFDGVEVLEFVPRIHQGGDAGSSMVTP